MMLLFLAALVEQAPHESPRAALGRIFAKYENPDFSPLTHPDRYFAPRLLHAIRADERLARPGYVGYLDFDPLCQCQDTSGFHPKVVNVSATSHNAAAARVQLSFRPPAKPQISTARITLVDTPAGWRIADIASNDAPSLLRALERSNARHWAHRR